jgi:hypothetical protein
VSQKLNPTKTGVDFQQVIRPHPRVGHHVVIINSVAEYTDGRTKMKPVPPHIIASGPPGTEWFGGAVDRSTMTLRVMSKIRGENVDKKEVAQLLGCESDQQKFKHWSLHAPDSEESDLDSQVDWILRLIGFSRVSPLTWPSGRRSWPAIV